MITAASASVAQPRMVTTMGKPAPCAITLIGSVNSMAKPFVRGKRLITRPRMPSTTFCWMITEALTVEAARETPRPTLVAAVSQIERE